MSKRALVLTFAAVLLLRLGVLALARGAGALLMADDPLERAAAVAVFSGGLPFRAVEAAELYHQGWAGDVWITRPANGAEDEVLARLEIEHPTEDVHSALVLQKLGCRPGAAKCSSRPS